MILVDTSAWIEVLKGRGGDRFRMATVGDEVVTCLPIMQEVLQGIDDERAFHVASAPFADIPILENPFTRDVFAEPFNFTVRHGARVSQCGQASTVSSLHARCAIKQRCCTSTAISSIWHGCLSCRFEESDLTAFGGLSSFCGELGGKHGNHGPVRSEITG